MPFRLPDPTRLGPDPEPPGVREPAAAAASPALPRRRSVLIAGGGPAALEAALALRAFGGPHLQVRLLSPQSAYVHRPLSVLEPFAAGTARSYDLAHLGAHGVRLHHGALASVDPARRRVTTDAGEVLAYDFLLVCTGARPRAVVPRAVTFARPAGVEGMHGVIQDLEGGWSRRIAFVAPPGATWTLPLYELALQTAQRATEAGVDAEITLVTHEGAPLEAFGAAGAAAATVALERAGVRLRCGVDALAEYVDADRVVALPVLEGRRVPGLPADADGFLPVDEHGRVRGAVGVYAAGDGTDGPVKQGGLATQQAEAAAEAIAFDAGVRPAAAPLRPVLRATLFAGAHPLYLRRRAGAADGDVSVRPLWWPPQKIAGHRLAPFLDALDAQEGIESPERALERRRAPVRRRVAVVARDHDGGRATTAMEAHR
jgi:sulfide:quinone oxidoreductase